MAVYAYLPNDGDVAFEEGAWETGRACWTSFSTFLDDWLKEGCFVCFVVLDLCFESDKKGCAVRVTKGVSRPFAAGSSAKLE